MGRTGQSSASANQSAAAVVNRFCEVLHQKSTMGGFLKHRFASGVNGPEWPFADGRRVAQRCAPVLMSSISMWVPDAARADQRSGAIPTSKARHGECSRSSPRGRRPQLPDGRETAVLPPRPPPVGRFARDGRRRVPVEGRLRRSAPAPASLRPGASDGLAWGPASEALNKSEPCFAPPRSYNRLSRGATKRCCIFSQPRATTRPES